MNFQTRLNRLAETIEALEALPPVEHAVSRILAGTDHPGDVDIVLQDDKYRTPFRHCLVDRADRLVAQPQWDYVARSADGFEFAAYALLNPRGSVDRAVALEYLDWLADPLRSTAPCGMDDREVSAYERFVAVVALATLTADEELLLGWLERPSGK